MTIRLNGSTSGYTEIDAPAVAGSNTLVLPTNNGSSGQFLRTNGNGALSWAAPGKILQIVQTVKGDTFSTATSGSNTFVSITGLSASITPSSASSRIFIQVELGGSGLGGFGTLCSFKVQRGGSDISGMLGTARTNFFQATAATMRASSDFNSSFRLNMTYLDSPSSTASLTYQVLGQAESSGFCINRTFNDAASTNFSATQISTITLMEVAA